jgi:hypothetical protein
MAESILERVDLGRRKQRGQQDDQIHEAIRDAGSQHVGEFAPQDRRVEFRPVGHDDGRPHEFQAVEQCFGGLSSAELLVAAAQALAILRELQPLTGRFQLVFPSVRSRVRPISDNTVNAALRRLGYAKDEITGHGFRSMASTMLNERGWNRDAIERQLAHGERDAVRAAYNYAEHLPERCRMMQAWSDYLEQLKSEASHARAA